MKKVLLYGADDWGEDDEPDTLSPRSKNMNEFKLMAFGKKKWKDEILKAFSGTD